MVEMSILLGNDLENLETHLFFGSRRSHEKNMSALVLENRIGQVLGCLQERASYMVASPRNRRILR
jgi:hypothetical protein